jgi:hypothetical protein
MKDTDFRVEEKGGGGEWGESITLLERFQVSPPPHSSNIEKIKMRTLTR